MGGGEGTEKKAFSVADNLTYLGLKSKYTLTWVTESAGKFSHQLGRGGIERNTRGVSEHRLPSL